MFEHKGESLMAFPDKFVVVDIETTGLDLGYCEIIEISAFKWPEKEWFHTMVKPEEGIPWEITKLTGITEDMVADAPDVSVAVQAFYEFSRNRILIGHNVNFDIKFLYRDLKYYHKIYLSNDFVDTLRLSRTLLPNLENHKLGTVANYYHVDLPTHRAGDDVKATLLCYVHLRKDALEKYGTLEEFEQKSRKRYKTTSEITTKNTEFDTSHPVYRKTVCFVGRFSQAQQDLKQSVVDAGGYCSTGITRQTDLIVMGKADKNSDKFKRAMASNIQIIVEEDFYELMAYKTLQKPSLPSTPVSAVLSPSSVPDEKYDAIYHEVKPSLSQKLSNLLEKLFSRRK